MSTYTKIILITESKKCRCNIKCSKGFYCKKDKHGLRKAILLKHFWIKLQNKFKYLPLNEQLIETNNLVF